MGCVGVCGRLSRRGRGLVCAWVRYGSDTRSGNLSGWLSVSVTIGMRISLSSCHTMPRKERVRPAALRVQPHCVRWHNCTNILYTTLESPPMGLLRWLDEELQAPIYSIQVARASPLKPNKTGVLCTFRPNLPLGAYRLTAQHTQTLLPPLSVA